MQKYDTYGMKICNARVRSDIDWFPDLKDILLSQKESTDILGPIRELLPQSTIVC